MGTDVGVDVREADGRIRIHPLVAPDRWRYGVSCLQGPDDGVEALFKRADAAVYLAKRTKNAVAVWRPKPDG